MPRLLLPERPDAELVSGLKQLGLALDQPRLLQLQAYLLLLAKWNRVYNLTAVRDEQQMVSRHLLDSLAVAPLITGPTLLDVGSGAGLPAIPLAIALPELQVTALDSNSKKTRFITQAKVELGLANLEVVQARVDELNRPGGYQQVISRAFSSLYDFASAAGPWCHPHGTLLAMKGKPDAAELAALAELEGEYYVINQHRLSVPGLDSARSVVEIGCR